jgi:hypothetical protein
LSKGSPLTQAYRCRLCIWSSCWPSPCALCSDLQIIPKMHRSLHSARRAAPSSSGANSVSSQRASRRTRAVRCKCSENTNTAAAQQVARRQLLHSAAGLALALQAAPAAFAAGLTLEDVTPTPAAAGRTRGEPGCRSIHTPQGRACTVTAQTRRAWIWPAKLLLLAAAECVAMQGCGMCLLLCCPQGLWDRVRQLSSRCLRHPHPQS